jgi:hypothetical protein
VDVPGPYRNGNDLVVNLAAMAAVDVARHLRRPLDAAARLAANARHDPLPGVRLANLKTLVRECPAHAAVQPALQAAAEDDPDAEVRLAAALMMGRDGRPFLATLAADGALDDSLSARALDALVPPPEDGRTRAILLAALRPGPAGGPHRPLTARAGVDALRRSGDLASLALLAEVLASQKGVIALAAVKALAALGTAGVVLPLQEAAQAHEPAVRDAAREAVLDVQARLTGSGGEVSLAAGDTGQVSLLDDARGRVSVEPHAGG